MAEISDANISRFISKARLIAYFASVAMALILSVEVNGQQALTEIEYYVDDSTTNQIPYFDNRFRIDAQLDEVTLLFYRRSGTQPVILVRPDGSKLKVNNIPDDKVQWFDDRTFDMIKIKSPMIGPWQVIGEVLPNSKIMVVSEIMLEVTPLPEIILQGETLRMQGRLFNGEKPIVNPAFNDVLELNVYFYSTHNSDYSNFGAEPIKLASFRDDGRDLDERANDSIFTGEFVLDFSPGEWEPVYLVKMPMATRELRQKPIIVRKNPISISAATTQNVNGAHLVTFTIDNSFVNADSILIQGKITLPDRQVAPFTVSEGQGLTRTHEIAFTEPGVHRIKIGVFGETNNGREFRATSPEFSFNVDSIAETAGSALGGEANNLTIEQKRAQSEANAAMEAEQLAQALAQAKASQEIAIADKQRETLWYIIAGNTLVITIAVLMFFFMRRKKSK
jgi:uncharacterized protein (TIGR03503 family)